MREDGKDLSSQYDPGDAGAASPIVNPASATGTTELVHKAGPFVPYIISVLETHTLSYDFTITPTFRPAPRWCVVQGQVDKKTFLHYDCGNKVTPCGPLGKEINGTITWEEQKETLRDVAEVLTQELLENIPDNYTSRDPLTLQGRMSCHRDAEGHATGSWQFGFNGQMFLLFDSENGKWALLHPGARQMREKAERDRGMTMFFHKISVGDCTRWFEDFWLHWEKMLKPTAPPTEAPGIAQVKARATRSICCTPNVLLTSLILLLILSEAALPSLCEHGLVPTLPSGCHLSSTCRCCPDLQELKPPYS
ncbi:UL16-binding protein 6-like [Microcebus murinus]|uniref:UL16-binding protein 6-like n=1 Tax=Microcebus murinus TaxID=30608 RepID=UPI003F6BCA07